MSFNTNKGRQSFTANGGQTNFDFNFKIYEVTDMKVYLTPVGSTPDDTADLLTYGSDYTIFIDGDNGGTVTLLTGATLNDTLVFERVLPRTRTTSYVTNGDLKAATLNADQDYQTYMLIDDFNTADRSLALPSTDVTMSPELPSTLNNGYLKVKSDGTGFEYSDLAGTTFEDLKTIPTVNDFSTIDTNLFTVAILKDTDRGGIFVYDASKSAVNNGGTIFDGWVRQYRGAAFLEWFGAKGDWNGLSGTDDTSAIQLALNTVTELTSAQNKKYKITDTLTINTSIKLDLKDAGITLDDATGLKNHIVVGDNITRLNSVEVSNIVFSRNQVATAGAAIKAQFVGILNISNCRIYGNSKIFNGIELYRGSITNIYNNYIDNCVNFGMRLEGTGLSGDKCIDTSIRENRVDGGVSSLVAKDFVEGLFVRDNIFYNASGTLVSISPTSDANGLISFKFQDNDFDTSGSYGMYIEHVSNIQITENWFASNTNHCIEVKQTVSSSLILDNQMYPDTYGINMDGKNTNISGNLISGGTNAINFGTNASNVNIVSNVIQYSNIGIYLNNNPVNVKVSDNKLFSITTTPISVGTDNTTSITNNSGDGGVGTTSYINPTGSPYVYTAGNRPECISIFGGTVTSVQVGGNNVAFTTNVSVTLPPNTSLTVAYSALPFMLKVRL